MEDFADFVKDFVDRFEEITDRRFVSNYRTLQEIYVKLRITEDRFGNDLYYVEDLVFVPRIIHWGLTDPPISYTFGDQGEPAAIRQRLRQQAAQSLPELLFPPDHEVVIMGSLGFRFSL